MSETPIPDVLLLEYRLTIAHRLHCECLPYLIERKDVLLPEIVKQAEKENEDAEVVFHRFALKVHARHADQETSGSLVSSVYLPHTAGGADKS